MHKAKINSINFKTYFLSILLILIPIAIILTISYKTFLGLYYDDNMKSSEKHIHSLSENINSSLDNYRSKIINLSNSINSLICSPNKDDLNRFLNEYMVDNKMISDIYLLTDSNNLIYTSNESDIKNNTFAEYTSDTLDSAKIKNIKFHVDKGNIFISNYFKSYDNDAAYELIFTMPLSEINDIIAKISNHISQDYFLIDNYTNEAIITSNNQLTDDINYNSYASKIQSKDNLIANTDIYQLNHGDQLILATEFKDLNVTLFTLSNSNFIAYLLESSGTNLIYSVIFCIILVIILITYYYYSNITEYNTIINYINNITERNLFFSKPNLPDPLIEPFDKVSYSLNNTFESLKKISNDLEDKSNSLSLASEEMFKATTSISRFTDVLSMELEKLPDNKNISKISNNMTLHCESLKDYSEETNLLTQQLTSLIKENQNTLNKFNLK